MFTLAEYTSCDGLTIADRATSREQQYAAIDETTLPDDAARAALARERRAAAGKTFSLACTGAQGLADEPMKALCSHYAARTRLISWA